MRCIGNGYEGSMIDIRQEALKRGVSVVGNLYRHKEDESWMCGGITERAYTDEAGNEYYIRSGKLVILTADEELR